MLSIADQIKAARKARGYTQQQVADKMGITVRYIRQVEAGQVNVTVAWLGKFASAIGARVRISFDKQPNA